METAVGDTSKESGQSAAPENNVQEKSPTPPPLDPPKKSKKEDRTKSCQQFLKSINSVPTIEEKFSVVCDKYCQSVEENKKLQFYIKQSDKRYALLLKEKEQLQHEFNKTILVKSKLENLCRELQKQNRAIKEESLLKIREEEERRKETQAKFQNTLSEITTLLQQNNEKNAKLREDNISMSEKFKSVVQQYQLREQQVDKMAKQMALESQLSDAKLQKASLEHQAEKERIIAEMEQLKVSVAQYRAKIMELQGTETALRGQLGVYTDKYDEFQNALVKSNQVFGGFKEQMEKMSKKIKKLEKESLSWKSRWETSQTALLDMCGERQASEERAAAAARQLHHMQSLCRTLQAERSALLGALKEHGIERPPLPAPEPPAPEPPAPAVAPAPASNAKVDAMAANCAQLRQSLAHLQSQLNVLTTNKNGNKEEPPKQEKPKKSKSKKNKDKQAQKAAEEPSDVKEPTENEPSASENTAQNPAEEKVDDKTLETLIQAINSANINLNDLEVINDENDNENVDEVLGIQINEVTNETNEVAPETNEVAPKTNEVAPETNEVASKTNEDAPKTNELAPKTNEVAPKTNAVAPKTNEVAPKVTEVQVVEATADKKEVTNVDKKKESVQVNSNEVNADLNVSLHEVNSNEEVSHIPEVKPIAVNNS